MSEAEPTRNFGASTTVRVDGSSDVRTLLHFNVPALSGPVRTAILRIYANSASSTGINARSVATTIPACQEQTVTYSNAPPMGTAAVAATARRHLGMRPAENVGS